VKINKVDKGTRMVEVVFIIDNTCQKSIPFNHFDLSQTEWRLVPSDDKDEAGHEGEGEEEEADEHAQDSDHEEEAEHHQQEALRAKEEGRHDDAAHHETEAEHWAAEALPLENYALHLHNEEDDHADRADHHHAEAAKAKREGRHHDAKYHADEAEHFTALAAEQEGDQEHIDEEVENEHVEFTDHKAGHAHHREQEKKARLEDRHEDAEHHAREANEAAIDEGDLMNAYSFQMPSTLNEFADMTAAQAGISVLRRESSIGENSQPSTAMSTQPVEVFCISPPSSPHDSEDATSNDEAEAGVVEAEEAEAQEADAAVDEDGDEEADAAVAKEEAKDGEAKDDVTAAELQRALDAAAREIVELKLAEARMEAEVAKFQTRGGA